MQRLRLSLEILGCPLRENTTSLIIYYAVKATPNFHHRLAHSYRVVTENSNPPPCRIYIGVYSKMLLEFKRPYLTPRAPIRIVSPSLRYCCVKTLPHQHAQPRPAEIILPAQPQLTIRLRSLIITHARRNTRTVSKIDYLCWWTGVQSMRPTAVSSSCTIARSCMCSSAKKPNTS